MNDRDFVRKTGAWMPWVLGVACARDQGSKSKVTLTTF